MKSALLLGLLPLVCGAWQEPDRQLKEAGVCARCHVISVVEWGVGRHWTAGTNCVACHGASTGHVIDERNNVKPDRMPRDAAATAALCAGCHSGGCPKTKHKAGCPTCHHVHALVNPAATPSAPLPPPAAPAAPARDPVAGMAREIRVDSLKLTLVLVSGGDVDLGSDRLPNARPVHTVRVQPFYLATHEITAAQWQSVMGAPAGEADLPATRVSWNDAQAFLGKLNASAAGGGFRLPTEAEWEFAARAAGSPNGASSNDAFGLAGPRAVGRGKPNALGLFDLAGNVWEWCSSLSRPYPYDSADGRESLSEPGLRVLRGGGYADPKEWVEPATRHADRPEQRLPWYGLRIARGAGPQR